MTVPSPATVTTPPLGLTLLVASDVRKATLFRSSIGYTRHSVRLSRAPTFIQILWDFLQVNVETSSIPIELAGGLPVGTELRSLASTVFLPKRRHHGLGLSDCCSVCLPRMSRSRAVLPACGPTSPNSRPPVMCSNVKHHEGGLLCPFRPHLRCPFTVTKDRYDWAG